MARTRLPRGAGEIWDMRLGGMKPNGLVVVSLVGQLDELWCVVVDDGDDLDKLEWRWAMGLPVCLVFGPTTPRERRKAVALKLAKNHAAAAVSRTSEHHGHVFLWDLSKQDGWLLSWWRGHAGFPEFDIPAIDEQITIEPILPFERRMLSGVGLD